MNKRILVNGVLYEAVESLNESLTNSFFVDLDDHSMKAQRVADRYGINDYQYLDVCGKSPKAWSTSDGSIVVYIIFDPIDDYDDGDDGHVRVSIRSSMMEPRTKYFSPTDIKSWKFFNKVTSILSKAVERDDDESWDDIERAWNLFK